MSDIIKDKKNIKKKFVTLLFLVLVFLVFAVVAMLFSILNDKGTKQEYSALKATAFEKKYLGANTLQGTDLSLLQSMNKDAVGWIEVSETGVDCPIMNSENYRYKNFSGLDDANGTPYLGTGSNLSKVEWNSTIYGSNQTSDNIFSDLDNYKEQDFWKTNDTLTLWSSRGMVYYEIFAVVSVEATGESGSSTEPVDFASYTDLSNQAHCEEFLTEIKNHQLYDTGIVPKYGDTFVTLCTYKDNADGESIMIFARKYNM